MSHERLECHFSELVLIEQPRTSLAALFCATCNFVRFVSDADDRICENELLSEVRSREEGLACTHGSVYASCLSGRSGSVYFSRLNFGSCFHREEI